MDRIVPTLGDLARAKWRSSGLSDKQASQCGMRILSAEETVRLSDNFHRAGSLKLPYFDWSGKETGFFRVRYLEPLPGFAGAVKKPQRYAQPAGTLNEVYFPPLLERPWSVIAADTDTPLYITEGEFKAAAGCAVGLATMGLGGVDTWRSSKRGVSLLPALEKIAWKGRSVTIVYDSDAATNPQVLRAQRQLAEKLTSLGALPRIAALPPTSGGDKQGLDDFLAANGRKGFDALLLDAEPFEEAEALWGMNEEVVYVRDPGIVVVRDTGRRMPPQAFVNHAYVNRHYMAQKITQRGVTMEKKPLADRWLKWERRFELEKITYSPGEQQIVRDTWNTWPGWGVAPKKGDIGPWKELLAFIFKEESAESRKWFEQWCAYPIQHPGVKLFTTVVVWGAHHGTGKTLIAYSLARVYGRNYIEIKSHDLRGGFNEWAVDKQLVYGDEITGSDKRIDADKLKGLITQNTMRVNAKYVPTYTIPDCINYYFTSNHPDAFFLEDSDRRFFVHEVVGAPLSLAFYDKYDAWYRSEEGAAALHHHLLHLDLEGFNPRAPAPTTAAKRSMILDAKSDLAAWVNELKNDPAGVLLPLGAVAASNAALFSAEQLLQCYDPEHASKVTVNGVARELKRAGFRQVYKGGMIDTEVGRRRLYAIRDADFWLGRSRGRIAAHYNTFFGPNAKKY